MKFSSRFGLGSRIMQRFNKYDASSVAAFNGQLGYVEGVAPEKQKLRVSFDS